MTKAQNGFVVVIDDDDKSIQYTDQTNLLSCLEQHDIEVHFHCREGFCGACRTRLIKGEVQYTTDPLAYIDDDEILVCCCKPLSDIKISIL